MKNGVHIIECLDGDDPGSEGRCLRHVFNLMEVPSKYEHVHSIKELVDAMKRSKYRYIHISTHGTVDKSDKFIGWWTRAGHGNRPALAALKGRLKCRAVISTACKSGVESLGRFLVDVAGSKYFIAPGGSPRFHNAILFSHIFYHKLFFTRKGVHRAFKSYAKQYKNPHKFSLFD